MKSVFTVLCVLVFHFIYAQVPNTLFTPLDSKQTHITFKNEIKESKESNVLGYEYLYNGGGVAAGDINNDGLIDLFFTGNVSPNKLYLNNGNFNFTDITKSAKVAGRHDWKTGVTMADVNGDGWLDIYVSYSGKGDGKSRSNELYINNHNLTFTESAQQYGLADTGCSTQAIFFDYDIDGDLDVYVLNHNIEAFKNVDLKYLKTNTDPLAADHLYRNDNGHFTDVSKEAGISGNPLSFGLGVSVSDINNDGWPDIYVSNDYTEQDYLYINNKNGTFTPRELYAFGHMSEFSMGNDIADFNNDGLVDIVTLDMLPEDNRRQKLLQAQENYELYQYMAESGSHYQFMRNMLQLNNGNGTFSEIGQLAGISNTDWSWSPLLADYDNDGFKDLYVTNGYMRDYTNKDFMKFWGDYLVKQVVHKDSINYLDIVKMMPVTVTTNYAFKNNGNLTFSNVSSQWGLKEEVLSNGAAYADLDNDGDLDLITNNINKAVSVYKNESEKSSSNHFLSIKLQGADKNTNGLGAKVYCYTAGQAQLLEQMPTRGYQSSVSEVLHFGLGKNAVADSIKVVWLDGKTQAKYKVPSNGTISFVQSEATDFAEPAIAKPNTIFSKQKALINFTHEQLTYNDFKRQPLMPVMYSYCGPKFTKGDVNGDGTEDIFIGGSQGQGSKLYLQKDGQFNLSDQPVFLADSLATTAGVIFFDANNDKHPDIYCVSGGYNDYADKDARLQDRLFINDGNGKFIADSSALPSMLSGKSCVVNFDFDNDGDQDLFIGGRMQPGAYPMAPRSYLLMNDGKGKFTDVTDSFAAPLKFAGMITDAKVLDYNKDGKPDLLVAGEWMAPQIYIQEDGKFIPVTNTGLENETGWWNTIEVKDIDNDGDPDIIAGNWGLNSQLKATEKEPVEMVYKDFDNNGSIDPILTCFIQGKSYPYISRDELLDEMYSMRKKFTSYKSYAEATVNEVFTADDLKGAKKLSAVNLSTCYFENVNGVFKRHDLPIQAQFSPVYKIVLNDFNNDGKTDILLLGNNENPRLKLGKMDANFGTLLLNDGRNTFYYDENKINGLFIPGDVKDADVMNVNGNDYLMVGVNGSEWLNFKIRR